MTPAKKAVLDQSFTESQAPANAQSLLIQNTLVKAVHRIHIKQCNCRIIENAAREQGSRN